MPAELNALLVLEDGTLAPGKGFGAEATAFGELVFNTSMTGYQEALTDPSYHGQILMMTYPLIGNYGVSKEYSESDGVKARGFVVHELCAHPSTWGRKGDLDGYLRRQGIPGIQAVDTRSLTIKTRYSGTLKAALATSRNKIDPDPLLERVRAMPSPDASDLVSEVSISRPKRRRSLPGTSAPLVVLVDCGVKQSILRNLFVHASVVQVPYDYPAGEVLALKPQGVLFSNGPGDPKHPGMQVTVKTIQGLLGKIPLFGICLGHQLLALALGGDTYKLKFGHRGSNQPVKDLLSGQVFITSQNHGYAVSQDVGMPEVEITQTNVSDGTVEGLRHKRLPAFSVQYHPEASPGPHDATTLFAQFAEMLK